MKSTKKAIVDKNNTNIFNEISLFASLPLNDHVVKYEEAFFDESNKFHVVCEYLKVYL